MVHTGRLQERVDYLDKRKIKKYRGVPPKKNKGQRLQSRWPL